MPETTNPDTEPFSLRAAVADNAMLTRVGKLSITVSFGVSTWREGESEDGLLAAADSALYRAKNAGRDRVSLADEPQPSSPQA